MTVAALFVHKGGVYYGLEDVDPWDEERDARLYPGPWPVVAHPPCNRWAQPLDVTGRVRGILCHPCNVMAGSLENPLFLSRALAYLGIKP